MILPKAKIQEVQKVVAGAFPKFTAWQYANQSDDYYQGFSIWGRFSLEPNVASSPRFYVTFDIYTNAWTGTFSVGKHSYFWSSADAGDARLLSTESCATLEEAIASLKERIGALFAALATKA